MIWVVGDKGMLGQEIGGLLKVEGLKWVGSDREVDFLDPVALREFAKENSPSHIVNCAAYTAVDRAEDEEALALRLNAEGPENLAKLSVDFGARLIHISTDYVFSGDSSVPYTESEPVNPSGAYGRTKAEGERRILAVAPDAIIIRTAWLYGRHGPNFVSTMIRLMKERDSLGVVADQRGSPTWARDLAAAILQIVSIAEFPSGIYHYTNEGETTWHEFAVEIQKQGLEMGILNRSCPIRALRTEEYPTRAKRPRYSVLDKSKIRSFGVYVPEWRRSLYSYLSQLTMENERSR
ncbi:MAG TPA: dTDP-4-dehydrorhamnose reductase [Spirochaetia bacterium]|nr:dTDP-4-dehydrorhamnose reductase [Spirochaetales bacterium]HRY81153.1 dTDP-4-dehydrorhamnose reductase [Spirochaetia bacterium]